MRDAINIRSLYACSRERCLACVKQKKKKKLKAIISSRLSTAEPKQQQLMLNTPNRPVNRGSLSEVNL